MTSAIHSAAAPTKITISPPPEATGTGQFFGDDGLNAGDVLDVVNPLQHIPFASTLYREVSGDTISTAATLIGGTLFGGVFGFFASLAGVIFQQETGHSVGGAVMAALRGEMPDPNIQLASNTVNLGDFAGDARRNVCTRDCTAQETAVAAATSADTTNEAPVAVTELAIPAVPPTIADPKQRTQDQQVLSLFGTSAASASAAYQKADMNTYLEEASTNLVL